MNVMRQFTVFTGFVFLASISLAHTFAADYYLDDFLLLSLIDQVTNPIDFFIERHFFALHIHRPMVLLSWWILSHMQEGPLLQYCFNAALLAANGCLFVQLLQKFGVPLLISLVFAVLWVGHPGSVIASSWLSDRFDLMASFFLLAGLSSWVSYHQLSQRRYMLQATLFIAAALLSKETVIVVMPLVFIVSAVYAHPLQTSRLSGPVLVLKIAVMPLLLIAYFGYRQWLGLHLSAGLLTSAIQAGLVGGILKWWTYLPAFILMLPADAYGRSPLPVFVLVALLVWMGCAAVLQVVRNENGPSRLMPILLGASMVLLVPVIQVLHFALTEVVFVDSQNRMSGQFVERFYFLGYMGLLMYGAGCLMVLLPTQHLDKKWIDRLQLASLLFMAILACTLVYRSLMATKQWPTVTRSITFRAQAAARALSSTNVGTEKSCRAQFLGAENHVFSALTEVMVKHYSSDDRIKRCIVESDGVQFVTLTHKSQWPNYTLNSAGADAAHVGDWIYLPYTAIESVKTPISQSFSFDVRHGIFIQTPHQ